MKAGPENFLLSVQCRIARLGEFHTWVEIAQAIVAFDGGEAVSPNMLAKFVAVRRPGARPRGWSILTVQRLDKFLRACEAGTSPLAHAPLMLAAVPAARELALVAAAERED
jgi:hypothetical protein